MQIVSSLEDNLHGMSKPMLGENINLSSAKFVQRVVKVNPSPAEPGYTLS